MQLGKPARAQHIFDTFDSAYTKNNRFKLRSVSKFVKPEFDDILAALGNNTLRKMLKKSFQPSIAFNRTVDKTGKHVYEIQFDSMFNIKNYVEGDGDLFKCIADVSRVI